MKKRACRHRGTNAHDHPQGTRHQRASADDSHSKNGSEMKLPSEVNQPLKPAPGGKKSSKKLTSERFKAMVASTCTTGGTGGLMDVDERSGNSISTQRN